MHRRNKWPLIALVVGLAIIAATITPGASAKTSHCLVINSGTGLSYSSLQAGVDAASSGDTLWVRGTCTGATTVGTSLTLVGQQPKGFSAPTLDGNQQGSVLTIADGVTATINRLTITHGNGGAGDTCDRLLESDSTLTFGGGICNRGTATLNHSTVSDNAGVLAGGGIFNDGALTLNNSTVSGNTAGADGGGILVLSGTVTLNGTSTITGNSATSDDGGGIYTEDGTTVTMNDSSSIHGNAAGNRGGGVFNQGTLNGAVAPPTLCPTDVSGFNVYCNTPDNIFSIG